MGRRGEHEALFPFVPYEAWASILSEGAERFLFWHATGRVEAYEGEADEDAVRGLTDRVRSILASGALRPVDVIDRLEGQGYSWVGTRTFDFRSGNLYAYARRSLAMAQKAADERNGILLRCRNRPPGMASDDWKRWAQVTLTMGACAMAARVLAMAAVDALVNEVLLVRFPAEYEVPEKHRHPLPRSSTRSGGSPTATLRQNGC